MCCSKRATREDRLTRIFSVFDVDGDGVISREDLELMVRQLAGSSFTCAPAGPPRPLRVLPATLPESMLPFVLAVPTNRPSCCCRMLTLFMVCACAPCAS